MGEVPESQTPGDQPAFITPRVAGIGPRRALEVGSFLGYGALAIARGLPDDGELVCLELDQGYAERARGHLSAAGLADRVEFRIGPALENLRATDRTERFDFAFIDAA